LEVDVLAVVNFEVDERTRHRKFRSEMKLKIAVLRKTTKTPLAITFHYRQEQQPVSLFHFGVRKKMISFQIFFQQFMTFLIRIVVFMKDRPVHNVSKIWSFPLGT
jgi:hypothetical protein